MERSPEGNVYNFLELKCVAGSSIRIRGLSGLIWASVTREWVYHIHKRELDSSSVSGNGLIVRDRKCVRGGSRHS